LEEATIPYALQAGGRCIYVNTVLQSDQIHIFWIGARLKHLDTRNLAMPVRVHLRTKDKVVKQLRTSNHGYIQSIERYWMTNQK
jgi:hypothetical protein